MWKMTLLAGAFGAFCSLAHADTIPGVSRYVSNALLIQVVQAPQEDADATFKPSDGQRVRVLEVLKGISTLQYQTLPKGSLPPGSMGLVLHSCESLKPQPTSQEAEESSPKFIWPLDSNGALDTRGVPREPVGWRPHPSELQVSLDYLKQVIVKLAPEEVGLQQDALAYLLDGAGESEAGTRAAFLKVILAIRGLGRDVPTLAPLLESTDPEIRRKAAGRLQECTGKAIHEPSVATPSALHAWAEAWKSLAPPPPKRDISTRWPEIPVDEKYPDLTYPEPLMQALEKKDADAFCRSFAAWLDSDIHRERLRLRFQYLDYPSISKWGLGHLRASSYLPEAPRIRADVFWSADIPAQERTLMLAGFATFYHHEKFDRERQDASELLKSAKADVPLLKKAAYWEMRADANPELGRIAVGRLAQMDQDEDIQQFLLGRFLDPYGDMLDLARAAIKKDRKVFVEGLLSYLKSHRDDKAGWIGRLFCQEKKVAAVPILIGWLSDANPEVRRVAALNLCWLPHRDAANALLEAIPREQDQKVRDQFLVALAQQRDARSLKLLITEASRPHSPEALSEILRGLGRLRDPAALPVLAEVAGQAKADSSVTQPSAPLGLLQDAILSFGYISGWPGARQPDAFWSSSGIVQSELDDGLRRIDAWRASRK